jgi:hypothetical protein
MAGRPSERFLADVLDAFNRHDQDGIFAHVAGDAAVESPLGAWKRVD